MSHHAERPMDASRLEEVGQLRRLEIASIIEAITLVVLVGLAVPLKYLFGWPLGVRLFGPIHGVAFLFYSWTVMQTVATGGWRRGEIVRLIAVAFLPSAGFFNVGWIRRRKAHLLNSEHDRS